MTVLMLALGSLIAVTATAQDAGPIVVQNPVPTQAIPVVSNDDGTTAGGATVAHPVITLPMVASRDILRNCALGQVVRGFRAVSATTMVTDRSYVEATGTSAEDVLDKLFETEIVYSLINPEDVVTGNIWLYGTNNVMVFYGYAQYKGVDIANGSSPQYRLWMQHIPLPLWGVESAEVLIFGEDGRTVDRINLSVNNGQPLFQEWLTGATNGMLSVKFSTDGYIATFWLANPKQNTPNVVGDKASYVIDGHHIVDRSPSMDLALKFVEPWTLPTILVRVTTSGQRLILDAGGLVQEGGGTYIEKPTAVFITRADGTSAIGEIPVGQTGISTISFSQIGDYRLWCKFSNFGKPGMLYTGPRDGKGSVGPELK